MTDIASVSFVFSLISILHLVCPCSIGLSRLSQPVVVVSLFARLQVLNSIIGHRVVTKYIIKKRDEDRINWSTIFMS